MTIPTGERIRDQIALFQRESLAEEREPQWEVSRWERNSRKLEKERES